MKTDFLPVSRQDLKKMNISQLDFVYIIGEAYVDHSSFGHAIISRVLENAGYKVGIIALPDWHSKEDFMRLGKPKLGFLCSAGNMDSMVNKYTVNKKIRSADSYAPGGKPGMRPDRATIVYCNRIREAYGNIPVIIGGVEASLRRFAHYDYWDNKVRRSILFDSRADLLIYGMGERQIVEIAGLLKDGKDIKSITDIDGTAYISHEKPVDAQEIPSFEEISADKRQYAISCRMEHEHYGRQIQKHGDRWLVVNKPSAPLTTEEMDKVYSLPYMRSYHPMYEKYGGVPAINEVKFSITSARGCFGSCNFCAIAFHQGRKISARSHKSIIEEAKIMIKDPDFKGYISDVGGPTANFRINPCSKKVPCPEKKCLYPSPCKNMKIDHSDYLQLLRKLRTLNGVKKVFIRSGIRYDYLVYDKNLDFFEELCKYHISGQLRVAPEHISDNVLKYMGKPGKDVYNKFVNRFYSITKKVGKEQYVVPYLMSSHPGSTINDAVALAEYLRDNNLNPEQVQDFYPTPGTYSTCMYYTELDPKTLKKVYVPKTIEEKNMQRALLQYKKPENRNLVISALKKAGRQDLIGFSDKCLIKLKGDDKNGKNIRRK
ncbi:MAG: YgiQ family radical SAM protein, partial [Clostridia bacterium]|nr:YgiQ family radical SAM protein [Clostridia bacterium]